MNEDERKAAARAKRLANLKPWKKGQSGNPKGMEKGYWQRMKAAAERAGVVEYWVRNVRGENPRATEDIRMRSAVELANRAWGKPLDTQVQLRIGENGDSGAPQLGNALESLARILSGESAPQIVEGTVVDQTATELATKAPGISANVAEAFDDSDE